MRIAAR